MKRRIHGKKSATVIIGAGFGDEGKGLLTDWAAAPFGADALVVRFNGGAQAGHTVVLPDGRRHVHSHFGSGTLSRAPTFLSRYFVNNPLLFNRELIELESKGVKSPVVFADGAGLVTTPYDMLLNRFAEQARGANRHGSCGVGFGETIERCLRPELSTTIADLAAPVRLAKKLEKIRAGWLSRRLAELGVSTLTDEQREMLFAADLKNNFLEAAAAFFESIEIAPSDILRRPAHIVFEGAQGLLLDQDIGWFPHVTRSNTGLKNVVELATEAGLQELEAIYATRCYATRHGAGPLPHELDAPPFEGIRDETNIHNRYQGSLRFALLDLDLLARTIETDVRENGSGKRITLRRALAITCLDQLDADRVTYIRRGRGAETGLEDFIREASRAAGASQTYLSRGSTRQSVSTAEKAGSGKRRAALRQTCPVADKLKIVWPVWPIRHDRNRA